MQFAVAKKRITPQKPVFLAGFAGRTHKSGEALDELYVKTVLLSANRNLLIVVFDALGADRGFVLGVKAALRERFGLEEADVLLQFTHTHASVYLTGELPEHRRGNYSIGQERWHDDSATIDYAEDEAFYREVKGIVLELTERCMATLEPGCVKLGVGRSRVAISRRKKSGTEVIMAPEPDAEIDDQLSVLALHDGQDRLKAILFSAGCHPTSMGAIYKISSEFCGNACMRLEQEFPEAIAVFMQGCAGDLRPRRSAADGRFHLCSPETMQAIGDDLAGEVMAVLRDGEFTAIEGPFRSTIGSLDLLTAEPDEDYLASLLAGEKGDYYRKAAERTVQAERNGIVKTKLPLYVQTWLLSDRAVLVALESEIPTGYSLRLKTEHADKTLIVLGYANGVYSYIPTRRILEEGGYEAEHPFTIGFKSRFALETEDRIVGEVLRQMTVLTE